MRISDWSSDVCSSDLLAVDRADRHALAVRLERLHCPAVACALRIDRGIGRGAALALLLRRGPPHRLREVAERSEEHTSELQSLMRISYAVFCLKKKKEQTKEQHTYIYPEHITISTSINTIQNRTYRK